MLWLYGVKIGVGNIVMEKGVNNMNSWRKKLRKYIEECIY